MIRTLLLFQLISLTFFNTLLANPVDTTYAKKIAANFYFHNTKNKSLTDVNLKLAYVSTYHDLDNQASNSELVNLFYVYSINNKGFIIIAADDDVKPVLGYSREVNFVLDNHSPAFNDLLNHYRRQILNVKQNNLKADNTIQSLWKAYTQQSTINNKRITKSGKDSVAFMLKTRWNQSPYFNALCPTNSGGLTVTGCVATAMAEIMQYWNHPAKGTGQHTYFHPEFGQLSANFANTTYDWAKMPDTLNSKSSPLQVNAIATLMYDCGVSINMDYNANGSGVTNMDSVIPAYVKYFYYAPTAKFASKYDYSDADWITLLEGELNSSRPMQCQGWGPGGGHSWILDGYDSNDLMHFNWGWGGEDNGYFSVDNLNPSAMDFNYDHKVIMGIQPLMPRNLKLALNSNITVAPDSITYNKPFTVNVSIKNIDSASFTGRFAAYLYYKNNYFFLIDSTSNFTLDTNSTGNTQNLTFSSNGISAAVPGNYKVGILYRTLNSNWLTVDSGTFKNFVNVKIVNPANKLKLSSAIYLNSNPLVQTSPFTLSAKIINTGTSYTGNISVVLYSEAGDSLLTLASSSNVTIDSAAIHTLTFSSIKINNPHGNYLLGILYKDNLNNWNQVASGIYTNPLQIAVNAHTLAQDKYEPDNIVEDAYNLKLVFANDTAYVNTIGSNINVDGDIDFYKVILPNGYDYIINAWLDDLDYSSNGQTYTTNVSCGYRVNSFWSDNFYDTQPMNFEVNDSAIVYFEIKNCYATEPGTYLLNIYIKRIPDSGIINHNSQITNLNIFPNPAKDYLTVQLPESNSQSQSILNIYNSIGQLISQISTDAKHSVSQFSIQTSAFSDGLYYLETTVNDKKYSNKFIINR